VFKDASGGRWQDCRNGAGAYGGVWTENIVSGLCRDILAGALLRLEAANYRPVLHVHDEVICEVPQGFGSIEEFRKLMTAAPSWALGLPIAAKAWSGARFSK
jgi:DNA polymerase